MTANTITEFTRRDLFDSFRMDGVDWAGRLGESEFLERVFTVSRLPSHDTRCKNMRDEIAFHRENWDDWGGPEWVYESPRIDLENCSDDKLLQFLAMMLHPLVRPNQTAVDELLAVINGHLVHDGYQLDVKKVISGKRIFTAVNTVGHHALGVAEAARIADTMASTYVHGQVIRMRESVTADPALAIGSAKEFVESIAKGILREQGVSTTGNETMPALVQMARRELNLTLGLGTDDMLKRTLSGLSSVTQGIAELRGKLGTGHGAAPDTERPPVEVARLVVGMATALGVFLYETHRSRTKPFSVPIPVPAPALAGPNSDEDIPF